MIDGLALLDVIGKSTTTHDGEPPAELALRLANELVAASLDEMRHIEALDVCGATKKSRRLYSRETESPMRRIYEEWLAPAQALLERVRKVDADGRRIERLHEFDLAVLLVQTLLMRTVDELEAALEDALRGNCVSIEEVRRELRARAAG
jgi:hypothetical protein